MRAVATVTGKDKVGIIARVSDFLSKHDVNIEDISQTVLSDYFAMIMLLDLTNCKLTLSNLVSLAEEKGKEVGMVFKIMHEDIFNSMHKV